ncbi:ATP-binding protein [Aequorivita flava]|uniref:histidine kinase n=1 Tax=Aequorivita flava TaxID=3114371 RepID=A0AB35YS67_9FLAO
MRFILFYCIAYIFFGNTFLSAQTEIEVDSSNSYIISTNYPIQNVFSKTKILKENAENISINDILQTSIKSNFETLKDSIITDKNAVWLHISFYPKVSLTDHQIILKRNSINNNFVTPHDSISAYYIKNKRIIDSTKSGIYIPASQKKVPFPASRNSFPISLKKDEPVELYLHIFDKRAIYTQLIIRNSTIPFKKNGTSVWLSAFALILAVYVLAFFFYTRDRSYLYLFAFYTCIAIYEHFVESNLPLLEFFFAEIPRASIVSWIVLTLGSKVFFLQFGRKFTNLKHFSPFWDKAVIGLIIYFLLAITIQLYMLTQGINPLNYYQYIFAGVGFLGVLVVTLRLFFLKDTLLKYFAFSAIWSFVFSILGILWENGVIPFWNYINPWLIANTGLMFILALAIARKLQLSERAKAEVEKVREIDSIKSKFFTNISHEFRTPLSLILGPINQSLENIPAAEAIEEHTEIPVKGKHLKVMKRNALRLQNLVEQILELSKLDQGEMKLQVAPGDLVQFLRSLVFSFESLTELKRINFQTNFPKTIPNAYYDRDKLEKIVVNLLSNAIKFTPEHGKVSVWVEENGKEVKISIADTGSAMKGSEIDKIFDRFYQTEENQDQGTGIGLALVKELVELYRGQINVDSTEGKGTVFKVIIPYNKSHFQEVEILEEIIEKPIIERDSNELISDTETISNIENQDSRLPLLLIIEDNPDLRHYIAEQLEKEFKIITAKDGKEGLKIAETQLPDLVISDVMMPKMTGIELCEILKKDIKTCHIPVILLTAKAGQTAKLKGLKTGADDYLTKPFDGHELLIRSKNLLSQRETLRNKFAGELKIRPTELFLNSVDEKFISLVISEVEKNLGNEYYSVEDLANSVGFSRSQLNRKLKSLTNKSPNQLIREFRLTRAKEMLEQKSASVSEIAYSVGYSNLSYFSKSYKEAFGEPPSET